MLYLFPKTVVIVLDCINSAPLLGKSQRLNQGDQFTSVIYNPNKSTEIHCDQIDFLVLTLAKEV
ncbi:hypothetical protein IB69_004780 [Xanthomonas citri]|nr:hypothetical protein IB69_004780 [Xanthomonas citri]